MLSIHEDCSSTPAPNKQTVKKPKPQTKQSKGNKATKERKK
jgi:hypothetical protein